MKKLSFKRIFQVILVIIIIALLWWFIGPASPPEEKPLPREEVTLYFLDIENYELARVYRDVPEADDAVERIFQIIESLKQSPEEETFRRLLPEDLQILAAYFEKDIVYVDFSEEFVGAAEGSTDEMLFLYSIVNSLLANLPEDYKLVQFLVNGEQRRTMGPYGEDSGHIGIKYPLGPRWIQDADTS